MFNFLEDQILDDAAFRAEQSRVSYNTQTEEFRNLNENLQTYLDDIKTIDEDNRQLQDNIEQIRTNYISTLENHLKRLPNDFREQSQKLTEGHIERYRIKSRTRRINNEREELKRRINFVASNEKEQTKRLNHLQKQERIVRNEFNKLNEQVKNLLKYVENEKQIHRQAMEKVDNLQVQHEQICIERSKTEFEIQTLREEVKLMQTAKEFLDEEHETILSTQTEANEYLLSRLNESITRIREDFDGLNKTQLKQFENEYKQTLQTLEESLLNNESTDETIPYQIEYEQLQNEYQSVLQELNTLNNHNKGLVEQILAMEADLSSLRNERIQEILLKDNELQRSKIELQTLNEKLNHFAEYDRNLKFELTLYRGVLESECRRKQQQRQSTINTSNLTRPTTLRSNNNLVTDKTTSLSSSTNQSKINDQQREQNLITSDKVQVDDTPIGDKTTVQSVSTRASDNREQLSSQTSIANVETRKSPTPSTSPILQENQSPVSQTIPSSNQSALPTKIDSISSDIRQSPSTPSQEHQPSSRTSSVNSKTSLDIQNSPSSVSFPTDFEYQSQSSQVRQLPSLPSQEQLPPSPTSSDILQSPISPIAPTVPEYQSQSSETRQLLSIPLEDQHPSEGQQTSLDTQKSPTSNIPKTDTDVQKNVSSIPTADSQNTLPIEKSDDEQQLTKSSDENDHHEHQQPRHSVESSSAEDLEIFIETKPNESRSSSVISTSTQEEDKKESLSKSDTNLSSHSANKTEEISPTGNISSTITPNNPLLRQDSSKQSSRYTSLTNIAEVDSPTTTRKSDDDDDDDDPNLASVMQDVRYVFHDLANDQDLVDINNDLPDRLLDRLEFRDQFIRILFDSLLRKYLVQTAAQSNRPATLDWIEFRDILFPILCRRYSERHIRKLFDLFDTNRDGYLSLQEITDLLEVLQATDAIDLAQNIIDEYDTDHDGKISVDDLIEAIKKSDDMNEYVLSDKTETKQWFNQPPIENQTISIEVPIINFPLRPEEELKKKISLLGTIFKNVGADSDSKQLDSNEENLITEITDEFIDNNVKISNDDLETFIELFINKKQKTDPLINWIEFRDTFLPIINNGFYFKHDIERWFDIFDRYEKGVITPEQIMQLLRLLQIQNPEEVIKKFNKTIETHNDNSTPWTLDDLMFALDTVDETASQLLTNTESISSFDINWLSNTIF